MCRAHIFCTSAEEHYTHIKGITNVNHKHNLAWSGFGGPSDACPAVQKSAAALISHSQEFGGILTLDTSSRHAWRLPNSRTRGAHTAPLGTTTTHPAPVVRQRRARTRGLGILALRRPICGGQRRETGGDPCGRVCLEMLPLGCAYPVRAPGPCVVCTPPLPHSPFATLNRLG